MTELLESANECLEYREEIPSAPLWHLGKIGVFGSQESYNLIQNTADYLTCKAQLSLSFTDTEKTFMKELFEAFWWGGKAHSFHEAAQLSSHYVNGKGKDLSISSGAYESSTIVQATMAALKEHIKERQTAAQPIAALKTTDLHFIHSPASKDLLKGKRSPTREGYMFSTGVLIAEQSNLRLKKADHQFVLKAYSKYHNQSFITSWEVDSLYDFEPIEKGYISHVPLGKNFTLKLHDGLSHYLTKIGVAKEFNYSASWHEVWR